MPGRPSAWTIAHLLRDRRTRDFDPSSVVGSPRYFKLEHGFSSYFNLLLRSNVAPLLTESVTSEFRDFLAAGQNIFTRQPPSTTSVAPVM